MHYELGLRDHLVPMLHGVDCQVSQAHTIHTLCIRKLPMPSRCLLTLFSTVFFLPAELLHRRRPRLHAAHTGVMHKCDAVLL